MVSKMIEVKSADRQNDNIKNEHINKPTAVCSLNFFKVERKTLAGIATYWHQSADFIYGFLAMRTLERDKGSVYFIFV